MNYQEFVKHMQGKVQESLPECDIQVVQNSKNNGIEYNGLMFHKKESGLSDRRQDRIYRKVKELLEQFVQQMKALSLQEKEDSWNWLRQKFMEKSDDYEDKKEVCGQQLEHAFDFMEAAFGDSQEMVAFITELNANYYSLWFIRENGSDQYYRHNKGLLFDDRQKMLLGQMEEVENILNNGIK